MTQIKEKTGICKSVVISPVVAIRGVVKNGFHCILISLRVQRPKIYQEYTNIRRVYRCKTERIARFQVKYYLLDIDLFLFVIPIIKKSNIISLVKLPIHGMLVSAPISVKVVPL